MGRKQIFKALLTCDKCNFQASCPSVLRVHSQAHSSAKALKCPNLGCDYKTRWPQALQTHQRYCRCQVQIPCAETSDGISIVAVYDKRGREGKTEFLMEQGNIFAGEPPYSCNFCGFSSKGKQEMMSHFEVHSKLHPAFCCPFQGCKYLAKWPQTVREHYRIVHHREFLPKTPLHTNDHSGPVMESEAETEVEMNNSSSSSSMAFSCTLCDFIGDSELSALDHARQHTAAHVPSDQN